MSNEEGNTDDSSDKSTEIKGLAHLLALKEEGWQQQAWLDLKQAVAHAHNQHHHGQHHGKRRASSAMNQSAVDHIHMDAAGGVHKVLLEFKGYVSMAMGKLRCSC